jgi:anaerobic selenocysteine-containing dehydrogenase
LTPSGAWPPPFAPASVAAVCGIEAGDIRRIARELAASERAAVYGRIGTCTQQFGTLASWLIDVLNVLTGNLDRRGGAMFPLGAAGHSNAAGAPGRGRGFAFGRWSSRVRGLGEVFGELPVACLAEEIETPGDGRLRALITLCGNPVLSTPNSGRLDGVLGELELIVSLDIYVNETTRHADVILPAPSPLRRSHYDLALYLFAVRNVAHYSPPVLPSLPELPDEWTTLLRLAGVTAGLGPDAEIAILDEQIARAMIQREVSTPESPVFGRDVDDLLERLAPRVGPERLLDLMLRAGPYGDGFGARSAGPGISLAALEAAPHGIDLGPLKPRLPDALRTASGKIELAPAQLVDDVERLLASLRAGGAGEAERLVLVGRRQLRSNNSWMHNLPVLVKGKPRCTLQVHPADAERYLLVDGEPAELRSRTGAVVAQVEVTDAIMPGVVSLPHGWGHDVPGTQQRIASANPGTNSNILADDLLVDRLSGNAVLNGIPVELAPVRSPARVSGDAPTQPPPQYFRADQTTANTA